jgi:hypothetical protein
MPRARFSKKTMTLILKGWLHAGYWGCGLESLVPWQSDGWLRYTAWTY